MALCHPGSRDLRIDCSVFLKLSRCFVPSSSQRWQFLRVLGPSLLPPAAEFTRSTRISNLCAPFPRSKKRQDSTSPREVPRGSLPALFPLFPPRVRHALGCLAPAGLLASHSSFNRSLSLQKSPWLINQNPEPPNSPSISLLMPGCDLNHFISRWHSERKLKPSRPFSTSFQQRTKSISLRSSAWKRKSITPFTSSSP
jgi:hypothetical protein